MPPRRTLIAAALMLGASAVSLSATAQPANAGDHGAPAAPSAAEPAAASVVPAPAAALPVSAPESIGAPAAPESAAPPSQAEATQVPPTTPLVTSASPSAASAPPVRPASPDDDPTAHLRFRHTWVTWDNAVNAQALGLGGSYQSSDPTYTMTGSFLPRYYLYDGGEVDAVSVDGRIDVIHEFTNSDATTRRGETTLSDATLAAGYARMLALSGDYETILAIKLPVLTFPTSKFSYENGTYLGVGTDLRLAQGMPLAGEGAAVFKRLITRVSVGYNHTFTRSATPTNPELHRFRLTPDGRTAPGDQLTGVAFPEHELSLRGRVLADVADRLSWWFEVSYLPTWKYGFGNVDICVVTGCAPAARPADPSTFVVVTGFQTEFMFELLPELGVSVGYVNVATQPGPDGQRRSIFYSPGAQVYVEFVGYIDAIYAAAKGHRGEVGGGLHLRP
jgi:hypothetical protein